MMMLSHIDPTQWTDSDGDGYGDNKDGNLGDQYPNDATKYADSDRDGVMMKPMLSHMTLHNRTDNDGDGMVTIH